MRLRSAGSGHRARIGAVAGTCDEQHKLVGIVCLDDLVKQLAADAGALVDIISREQDREHRLRR